MRILASGDIHGDVGLVKKLAERAVKEKVDVVVISGDITFGNQSTDNLIGPFKEKNLPVLIIPGNHEPVSTIDFLAEMYNIKNLHGYSAKYKDVGIFGAGGANIGIHQQTEREIFDSLKKGFDKIKYLEKKVMVTHVHPTGSKMERFTQFFPGSSGVRKAIDEFHPDILICSHVHEADGIEETIGSTKVISVGKKGKIIDI